MAQKSHHFRIIIEGISFDQTVNIQSLALPKKKTTQVSKGTFNSRKYEAGDTYVDGMLKMVILLDNSGLLLYDKFVTWSNSGINNTQLGTGSLPEEYKENMIVQALQPNMIDVLDTWVLKGVWPANQSPGEFKRPKDASENVMYEFEFSVDDVI